MNRSPLAASIVLVLFAVGVPIALIRRLAAGVLPTQPFDIALGIGVLAWIFIAKALLERDDPMSNLIENRLSPDWQAHSLVEQSMAGVGFLGDQGGISATSPRLYQLQSATFPIEALMPPVVHGADSGRSHEGFGEAGSPPARPTLRANEPAVPPAFATEEYVLGRGDTLWSIAEERLGDGRRWKSIEALNLGRDVAPGVVFGPGDSIRIGWSVLVPRDGTTERGEQ